MVTGLMDRRRQSKISVTTAAGVPTSFASDMVRPALQALPRAARARLRSVSVSVSGAIDDGRVSSRWRLSEAGVRIEAATVDCDPHDVAIEVLLCLGQALWERITERELGAWLAMLLGELADGVSGEIDESPLALKETVLAIHGSPPNRPVLDYARASFAATLAEYVHSLWHDVTVRSGPEHLPAPNLRKRFELLAKWFPPDPGYTLYSRSRIRKRSR